MSFLRFSPNWLRNFSLLFLFVIILNMVGQSQCNKLYSSHIFNLTERSNSPQPIGLISNDSSREARRSVVSGGLFSIISFDNVACNGTDGTVGTCYSARECQNIAGYSNGKCAGNFGVCCSIQYTCGATVSLNNTYFVNPGYPTGVAGPLTCSVTVKQLAGATELYLDFNIFNIRGPSGPCTNDTFTVTVSGVSTTYPVSCGNNTALDEYISWGSSATSRNWIPSVSTTTAATVATLKTATLTFTLASGSDLRSWNVRIVQFKSTDACAAPAGCLQYYRGTTGTVQSYNYNLGQGELISTNSCINQCFQLPSGYCSMLLTAPSTNSFMLPGTSPSTCTTDYLLVNGQQFCGDTLGTNGMLRVNQSMGLSYLSMCLQTGTTNVDMDLGYSLTYTLQAC